MPPVHPRLRQKAFENLTHTFSRPSTTASGIVEHTSLGQHNRVPRKRGPQYLNRLISCNNVPEGEGTLGEVFVGDGRIYRDRYEFYVRTCVVCSCERVKCCDILKKS